MKDWALTTPCESQATRIAENEPLWLEQIMFRVRDAVKFGASRVCPMCNRLHSRHWEEFEEGAT
jgi:hypothetical protein